MQVLQGDADEALEPYLKPDQVCEDYARTWTLSYLFQFREHKPARLAQEYCARLGMNACINEMLNVQRNIVRFCAWEWYHYLRLGYVTITTSHC